VFRKMVSIVCVLAFLFSLYGISQAAAKKKVVKMKVKIVKKGKRPTFPAEQTKVVKLAPIAAKPVTTGPKAGFLLEGGYGGGAVMVGVGYSRPFSERLNVIMDADYGFGNGYSVILARVGGDFSFGNAFAGLAVAYTSYSAKVQDIPGLSGTFDKGNRFGGELSLGYAFGALKARLGYNTGLAGGLTASAMYIL